MRRIGLAAYCLLSLSAALSSCAFPRNAERSPAYLELRTALSAYAGRRELRAYDRAWEEGPDSLGVFIDRFWSARDPTPGTARNEFRERFEQRLKRVRGVLRPPGRSHADDRLIAYLRWGVPAGLNSTRYGTRSMLIGWAYAPDPEVSLAGYAHRLLRRLTFVATFSRDAGLVHALLSTPGKARWRRPPRALKAGERDELDRILSDTTKDRYLRAAAAWRLRADAGPEAFAVLLRHAHDPDPYVAGVIGSALAPLAAVRTADGREVIAVEGTSALSSLPDEIARGIERAPQPARPVVDPGDDPIRWSRLVNRIYDPAARLSPQAVAELGAVAAASDSILPLHGWLSREEAERVFVGALQAARMMVDAGEFAAAHELLNPLLKRSLRRNAEAWHLDAIALLESAEPGGRRLAEERVREALRLDPGNVRYQVTLARIFSRRTLDRYADHRLDRILEEVPAAGDAYALKARMRLEVYWALGWKGAGWATPLSERAMASEVAVAEALDLFNRALIVDPDNELATWWLGLHYLMTGRWEDVIPVMTYMLRQGVHIPEALLGRGLAFQHLGRLDMAWRDYQEGLGMLPEPVRLLAADPRWVLPPSRGGRTLDGNVGKGAPAARRGAGSSPRETPVAREAALEGAPDRFWRAKDPLFATDLNERLVEQVRRFAYVTWRFAVPNLGLSGWDTHRGRIYLRYGEPLRMATQAETLREKLDPVAGDAGGEESLRQKAFSMLDMVKEVWRYEDMTFTFGGGMTSGNMVLWPSDRFGDINSRADFEDLVERVPESKRVEGDREVRELDATWYRFEGPGGGTELVPVARFDPGQVGAVTESVMLGNQPVHLILLDGEWRPIAREETALPRGFRVSRRGTAWVGPLLRYPSAAGRGAAEPVPPVFAAVEVVPAGEGPAFASRDTLIEPGEGRLRLSSLVVATNIQPLARAARWPRGTYFTRFGQAIVPRADGRFEPNEPLFVYAEVYGLAKDAIGATDYQLALTITALDRRRGLAPLVNATVGRLIGRQERRGSVTLLFGRSDIRSRTREQVRIVFPRGEYSDAYEVRFEIRDRVSGATAARTIRLVRRGSSSGA